MEILSNSDEEERDVSERPIYFRGRPFKTTGKARSRYESSDDHTVIDFSKPLPENIHDALVSSICAGVGGDQGGISKQIRLSHLNGLVRIIEKCYQKQRTCSRDGVIQQIGFKQFLKGQQHSLSAALTFEQILVCLRYLLTDEEREIRAAALRVLRYVIRSDEDLEIALNLHLDILIVRCLDVVLDNRVERTHCMRLLLFLIHHCPKIFPSSLVQPLLAICLDGQEENDKLARAATAALCELVILNPDLILQCGGIGWLIRSILISGQSTPRLAECMTNVLTYIYNNPRNRIRYGASLKNVFYDLLASFMDEHFRLSTTEKEEKTLQIKAETEQILDNCRAALVTALHSWPGIIGCFSCSSSQAFGQRFLQSPVHVLVASLCLDSEKIREFAVQAICEILNVPYQYEHCSGWEKASDFIESTPLEDYKYSLSQQFVNADAIVLLDNWNKSRRLNLSTQTAALILVGLVDAGLPNVLAHVIIGNPDRALEIKMTLLLSDILEMCGQYLPSNYRQMALSLPTILESIYSEMDDQNYAERFMVPTGFQSSILSSIPHEVKRKNAVLLAYRLNTLSSLKRHPKRIRTLQMENLLSKFDGKSKMAGNDFLKATEMDGSLLEVERTLPRIRGPHGFNQSAIYRSASLPPNSRLTIPKSTSDRVHELIRDSRTTVPYSNHTAWDWSLIYLALCQMCEYKQHLEDHHCSKFTNQLVQFFDPDGGQFCKLADDYRSYSRVGCVLMWVLGSATWDSTMNVQLRTFLAHLGSNLLPERLHVGQLSVKNVSNGPCADYFCFIGQLSDTESGKVALEKIGIMQRLVDLINNETHDAYVKLVISSMIDYDKPSIGRMLLRKALTTASDSARIFATAFLLTLGKLKVHNFAEWGLEMAINQLRDGNRPVVEEAAQVLEELINDEKYLSAFIRLRPSLLSLGDAGILFLSYIMSDEHAVMAIVKQSFMEKRTTLTGDTNGGNPVQTSPVSRNFVGNEIERWKTTFNAKYSRIIDERLCEAFSSYCRLADGSFPRHASRSSQIGRDVYLPPHLYGELARHETGCQLLRSHDCVAPLLEIINSRILATEGDSILTMKSAMWALGHMASTDLGFTLLPPTILSTFVNLAQQCPVLTVRGCAFYVVNLLAQSSPMTRDRLRQLSWEATTIGPSLVGQVCEWRKFKSATQSTENSEKVQLSPVDEDENSVFSAFGSDKPVFTCLPQDVKLICNVTDWPLEPSSSTANITQLIPPYYPAKVHCTELCLHCNQPGTTESLEDIPSPSDGQKTEISDKPKDADEIRNEKTNDQGAVNNDQQNQKLAFRKELLRLITLLSVRKKYAEQGLLRLKQEAPQLFRSLCTYCDVVHIMSSYTFRLSARRFLQELFQDVDFGDLFLEPQRILHSDHRRHLQNHLPPFS